MDSGFLYSAMSLNGKKGVYLIEVDVFDGVFRDQANINITVLDVNQNQPIFVHPSTNNSTLSILEVSSSYNLTVIYILSLELYYIQNCSLIFKIFNSHLRMLVLEHRF